MKELYYWDISAKPALFHLIGASPYGISILDCCLRLCFLEKDALSAIYGQYVGMHSCSIELCVRAWVKHSALVSLRFLSLIDV